MRILRPEQYQDLQTTEVSELQPHSLGKETMTIEELAKKGAMAGEPTKPIMFCPFCGTWQVQLIPNYANRDHDMARCRNCKASARLSVWNKRNDPAEWPE